MADWNTIAADLAAVLRARGLVNFGGVSLPVVRRDSAMMAHQSTRLGDLFPDLRTPEKRAVWAGWLTLKVQEAWSNPALFLAPTSSCGWGVWDVGALVSGHGGDLSQLEALIAALKAAPAAGRKG